MAQQSKRDPTEREISERCAEIQRGWSDRERLSRLRSDLRPCFRGADGECEYISADAYAGHLAGAAIDHDSHEWEGVKML